MSRRVLLALVAFDAFFVVLIVAAADEIAELADEGGGAYVAAAVGAVAGGALLVVLFMIRTLSDPSGYFLPLMVLGLASVPFWSLLPPMAEATLFGFLLGSFAASIVMVTLYAIVNRP